jgi:hypothetical protein
MKDLKSNIILLAFFAPLTAIWSQTSPGYQLTEPVKIELNRLDEAYQILDQFTQDVWEGWDDYMNYPFLFTFQNGLRILAGHPAPPKEFVPYPGMKVHGLTLHVDTTNLNDFEVKQPLQCGGGVLTLGSFNDKPVTIVDMSFISPLSVQQDEFNAFKGENTIITFIHELMHCYQPKILKYQYGNLRINPDLNFALYSDIEGQALLKAYEHSTLNESLPFLKDFCVARSLKTNDLSESEKSSNACDEFREGEAVYSEFTVLTSIKKGFTSAISADNDPDYNHFADIESLLNNYIGRLKSSAGNTLEIHEKTYWYGCLEALLLQRYFPGWQNEIEKGAWLDQIIRENVNITPEDSLLTLQRYQNIYHIDSLKNKHGAVISDRDITYEMFREREGRTYILDFKPISQFLSSLVDKTVKNYQMGLIYLYPEGIKELIFDEVSVSFKPVPIEINQLYFLKVIDVASDKPEKPYYMKYESKDNNGFFYKVTITTPLFTLKAPKISVRENSNRVKFIIHSRVSGKNPSSNSPAG